MFFSQYLELSSKTVFNKELRKLPSQYGEFSVMSITKVFTLMESFLGKLLNTRVIQEAMRTHS